MPGAARTVDFWSALDGDDGLHCAGQEEALQEWLEDCDPGEWPSAVTLYGYARMQIDEDNRARMASLVLERLLEDLDDEYSNGDEWARTTATQQQAARAFVDAVLTEYRVWGCEIVETVEVPVPPLGKPCAERGE